MFVKIGRFGNSDAELLFQEQEEGNIIKVLDSVINQLNHKFLIAQVGFEGMNRIEKSEYPIAALREMLLNALVHRNYMGAHIQIRVYIYKISIWNDGQLPEGITLEALKHQHASKPRNPIIADVCFKGGYIDSWGRGTIKIMEACKNANLPEPEFKEASGGFLTELYKDLFSAENIHKLYLSERQTKAILFVKEKHFISNSEYMVLCNVSDRTALRDLDELVEKGLFQKIGEKKGTKYQLKFGG